MGIFLNRGNEEFDSVVHSQIYIDKTDILHFFNRVINTEQRYICVSRPRRFGKSVTANTIAAYFEKGCDSRFLFEGRKLSRDENWDCNLNKYDVIRIDLADIRATTETAEETLNRIDEEVVKELDENFPDIVDLAKDGIADALAKINDKTGAKFVIIIDEWDCLFRDDKANAKVQERYINLLRGLFKGNRSKKFTVLAYLTGILPIKKYNSESALNNFYEYTMTSPKGLAEYIGFTEDEVKDLCEKYQMDYEEIMEWYDGYRFQGVNHIYGQKSVVRAMFDHMCENYWSQTVAYNNLVHYITMNFDGLRDDIVAVLGGHRVKVKVRTYENDMTNFKRKDDVLTALIHLGYLAFDETTEEAYLPNKEVRMCFEDTIEDTGWDNVIRAVEQSEKLLRATIARDEEEVAEQIDICHRENTSILNYHDENSLASCITLAYYTARNDYNIVREMPAGYGFADMVFVPLSGRDKPAMVIELKWNRKCETALEQIREKKYVESLKGYKGEVLLVGISYEKRSENKTHVCRIERVILE